MTELNAETLRRKLALEQAINAQLDALVKRATHTARLLAAPQHSRMEESQLRNLLNVASQSRSVEVVVNFIRYQIARNSSAWGTAPGDFGHTVIADLRGPVAEIAKAASAHEKQPGEAMARVMPLYLGYLHRAFYYGKKANGFSKLEEIGNAT